MVDGSGVGDVGEAVLRDRKHLSADGIMMVVVTVDSEEARIVAGPDLISRGVYYLPESGGVLDELKAELDEILAGCSAEGLRDVGNVKEHIRAGTLQSGVRALEAPPDRHPRRDGSLEHSRQANASRSAPHVYRSGVFPRGRAASRCSS